MATKTTPRPKRLSSYMRLVAQFPLASIRSERQLRDAQATLDRLSAKGKLDAGERLYFDALCDLVEVYEDAHHAIEPASDAAMLQHLLEMKGITQAELHRQTGLPRSTISEILAGKKCFSRTAIRTLAAYFQIDVSILTANL